jgi:hypothetical protein
LNNLLIKTIEKLTIKKANKKQIIFTMSCIFVGVLLIIKGITCVIKITVKVNEREESINNLLLLMIKP